MTELFERLRSERLKYALKRELDRQVASMDEDAIALLAERARIRIETAFEGEEDRNHASERAERSLMPIIHAVAKDSIEKISISDMQAFLDNPKVQIFPWSAAEPI